MSLISKAATAAATFGVALGLGYIVQNGETSAERYGNQGLKPVASSVSGIMTVDTEDGTSAFELHDIVTTPLPHIQNVQTVAALERSPVEVSVPEMNTIQMVPFAECQTALDAKTGLAAMVALSLSTPCHVNTPVIVVHEGMRFSAITDEEGNANVNVPAMAEDAAFSVRINNLEIAYAEIEVSDFTVYDRAVLQWRGMNNLQLHALEFGATFGDRGHVWSASANQMELTRAGQRGFMTRLGTTESELSYQAEIYTFPSGLMNRDGEIVLQVGAAVTERNCGREVDAQGIQTNSGQMLITRDLRIQMPGCNSIGQSVMMRDLFNDVTIAAN